MDTRIEQLETKIAFLEQANAQLGDELYRLNQDMEALRQQLALLAGRIAAGRELPTTYADEEERPPHY